MDGSVGGTGRGVGREDGRRAEFLSTEARAGKACPKTHNQTVRAGRAGAVPADSALLQCPAQSLESINKCLLAELLITEHVVSEP